MREHARKLSLTSNMSLAEARPSSRRRRDQTPRCRRLCDDPCAYGGTPPRARTRAKKRKPWHRCRRFRRPQPLESEREPTAARKRALVDRSLDPALRFGTLAGRPGRGPRPRSISEPGQRRRTSTVSADRPLMCRVLLIGVRLGIVDRPRCRSGRADHRALACGEPFRDDSGDAARDPVGSGPRRLSLSGPTNPRRDVQCVARAAAGRRRSRSLSASLALRFARNVEPAVHTGRHGARANRVGAADRDYSTSTPAQASALAPANARTRASSRANSAAAPKKTTRPSSST